MQLELEGQKLLAAYYLALTNMRHYK